MSKEKQVKMIATPINTCDVESILQCPLCKRSHDPSTSHMHLKSIDFEIEGDYYSNRPVLKIHFICEEFHKSTMLVRNYKGNTVMSMCYEDRSQPEKIDITGEIHEGLLRRLPLKERFRLFMEVCGE